jgi:hypothetical protein
MPLLLLQRNDLVHCEDVMFSGLKETPVRANFRIVGIVNRGELEEWGAEGGVQSEFIMVGHEIGRNNTLGQLQMFNKGQEVLSKHYRLLVQINKLTSIESQEFIVVSDSPICGVFLKRK